MDMRDLMDFAPDGSTRIQRACDSCRSRKIKCDRVTPCSNCRASKLNCQTTAPTQKAPKQRIHVSDEYERKIDRIEDRLTGIEHLLETLAAKLDKQNAPTVRVRQSSPSKPTKSGKSSTKVGTPHEDTPPPFEGETTLNAQSEHARELLEKAVGSSPSIGQNTEFKAALASLQSIVDSRNQTWPAKVDTTTRFCKVLTDTDAAKLEQPPWDVVSDVIDTVTIKPTVAFIAVFPYLKMHNHKQLFKEAFDSPGEASPGRRILVYGILYYAFVEFASYPIPGQNIDNFSQYASQCKIHMECAMAQLEFFLPASQENVLALMLAAEYAVQLCKPTLCWIMTGSAAMMCQHLGYHHISSMKDVTPEERSANIYVFWYVYAIEKTLCLRLGRASAIQDWDVSLPYPTPGDLSFPVPGVAEYLLYWIKLAQIQGQTYEQLFSAAAFLKPEEERTQIATDLVSKLNQAWAERGDRSVFGDFIIPGSTKGQLASSNSVLPSGSTQGQNISRHSLTSTLGDGAFAHHGRTDRAVREPVGDYQNLLDYSDAVVHHSTATLIQRAVNNHHTSFSHDCLDSARAALMAHLRCHEQFNVKGSEDLWSGYMHWSILQSPFTPFIVLFCNAITTCSDSDIPTLASFIHSLESCRSTSEGADRLYKMCQLFLSVAKLYVAAKSKEGADTAHSHSTMNGQGFYTTANGEQFDYTGANQIDPYLSALGLVPNTTFDMQGYPSMQSGLDSFAPAMGGPSVGDQNQNPVQHWFSGSRYIMGLMEDDLNMPDLPDFNI